MATARQQVQSPSAFSPFNVWLSKRKLLLGMATATAALCGIVAFFFFAWRDRGHTAVMVNEQTAPVQKAATALKVPSSSVSETAKPAEVPPSPGMTRFNLDKSPNAVPIGPVRVRLLKADPKQRVYSVSILVGRRSFLHNNLKAQQPLWVTVNRSGRSFEMIVPAIYQDAVGGFWAASNRSPQLTARKRPQRTGH